MRKLKQLTLSAQSRMEKQIADLICYQNQFCFGRSVTAQTKIRKKARPQMSTWKEVILLLLNIDEIKITYIVFLVPNGEEKSRIYVLSESVLFWQICNCPAED